MEDREDGELSRSLLVCFCCLVIFWRLGWEVGAERIGGCVGGAELLELASKAGSRDGWAKDPSL